MHNMFRKTLIAIAAAATLAIGLGAATAPAEARHRHAHIGIYFGAPYVGFYHRSGYYRPRHCHVRKIRTHHGWKRIKTCHRHGYGYY
jgi:hypothetical protein